jgi:hypothetical protein
MGLAERLAVIHDLAEMGVAGFRAVLLEGIQQVVEQGIGQVVGADVGRQIAENGMIHRLAPFQGMEMGVVFRQPGQAPFGGMLAFVGEIVGRAGEGVDGPNRGPQPGGEENRGHREVFIVAGIHQIGLIHDAHSNKNR